LEKVFRRIGQGLPALAAAVLLLAIGVNVATLWAMGKIKRGRAVGGGYYSAIVSSGSMTPAISVGDWLIIKGGGTHQLHDIITYVSPSGLLVTHRVIAVTQEGYMTQGDANNMPDSLVPHQRVLGKVIFALPGVGGAVRALFSPISLIIMVALAGVVFWILRLERRAE